MLTTYKRGAEKRLIDLIAKLRDGNQGYFVVHFNFSGLAEHYKNEYQQKISINIINDIMKDADGYIFIMHDYDIFAFCRQILPNVMKKMVFQLRYLYMDDPLAYLADSKENPEFCEIFELKIGWQRLFDVAKIKMEALEEEVARENNVPSYTSDSDGVLTPGKLADVELELGKTNITSAFRSQPVCAARADGFKVMFSESYINMSALNSQLKTQADLLSNRLLFKYLTQVLDRKMIEFLAKNQHKHLRQPISLNLNVATLLSESFSEFDRALDVKTKKNIIIEIQVADVFNDMEAFITARNLVQGAGYRICLDGLTNLSFLQVDRNSLGFDLAKIFWNADLRLDSASKENKLLLKEIDNCGASRVILARCDTQDAIYYGQSLGVGLFQGRYVDSMIDPDSSVVN